MNNKGFVTSALLYGILSLFIVLVLGTVSILANRKLANDKIKESALDDVQQLTTDESCFTTISKSVEDPYTSGRRNTLTITGYSDSCDKTVFIPETINGLEVDEIGSDAFKGKSLINITIKENITSIGTNAFSGNDGIVFYIKSDSAISGSPWGATNSTIHLD